MGALQIESQSIGQTLRINARFGRLMLDERLYAGRSLRAIARKVRIKRETLKKWEAGKASPPARAFMTIMRIYGREALFRAGELDLQIQIEKYALVKEKTEKLVKVKAYASEANRLLAA